MSNEPAHSDDGAKVSVIRAVRSPLNWCMAAFMVLAGFGCTIALKTEGRAQAATIVGLLLLFLVLTLVVALLAWFKPEVLVAGNDPEAAVLSSLCQRFAGPWWNWSVGADATTLGLLDILPDPVRATVRLSATQYNHAGSPVAHWRTLASCVDVREQKLLYYWVGEHEGRPGNDFRGWGEVVFRPSPNGISRGSGRFSDTEPGQPTGTQMKETRLQRMSEDDAAVMRNGTASEVAMLVAHRWAELA